MKQLLLALIFAQSAWALRIDNVSPGSGPTPSAESAKEGQTTSFSISATDDAPITYQWIVDGVTVAANSASFDYSPGFDTVIHPSQSRILTIACLLQAGAESATVTWDGITVSDSNRVPTLNGDIVVITPARPTIEHRLRCTLLGRGLDPDPEDNDDLRYLFTWRQDEITPIQQIVDAPADPQTNPSVFLDNVQLDREQIWTCEVELIDRLGGRSTPTSATATITNSPPSLDAVVIDTDSPATISSTLIARVHGLTDLEDDSVNLLYEWQANGVPIANEVGNELDNFPAPKFYMGDVIRVVVTADDGFDAGAPVFSAEIAIAVAWEMRFSVNEETLLIGMHDDAQDGFDAMDVVAGEGLRDALISEDGTRLSSDIRATDNDPTWELYIDATDSAKTLSWTRHVFDLRTLPQAFNQRLMIRRMDAKGEPSPSTSAFINTADSISLRQGSVHRFRIEIGDSYQTALRFQAGWNLFALPLNANSANTSPLPGPTYSYVTDGLVRSAQFAPFAGYWVHCPRALSVDQTSITLSDGQADLQPGWNLIGGGHRQVNIADRPEIQIAWYWDTPTRRFRAANTLLPGRGYWVYTTSP